MTRSNRFLTGASLTTLILGALVLPTTPAQAAPQDSTFTPNGTARATPCPPVCAACSSPCVGCRHSPPGWRWRKGGSVQLTVPAASGNTFTIKPGPAPPVLADPARPPAAVVAAMAAAAPQPSSTRTATRSPSPPAAAAAETHQPARAWGRVGRGCRRPTAQPAPTRLRDDHGGRRWWRDDDRARHRRREPRGRDGRREFIRRRWCRWRWPVRRRAQPRNLLPLGWGGSNYVSSTAIAGTVTNITDAGSTADGKSRRTNGRPPAPSVTGTVGISQASLVITPAANPETAVTGWQYRLDPHRQP